jgi:hypothetical protein
VTIAIGDRRRFDCPSCGPNRTAIVKALHQKSEREDYYWCDAAYLIMECPACDAVFFGEVHTNSEDIEQDDQGEYFTLENIKQWPKVANKIVEPAWLEEIYFEAPKLHEVLKDTYFVANEGRNLFAAIGFRTCIDHIFEKVGVDPALTFSQKSEKLLALGKISQEQKSQIDVAIDAGSAAVHQAWKPNFIHVDAIRMTVEALIFSLFVNPNRMSKLSQVTPTKPKRQQKQ